jgi:hypothetical protein
LVLFDTSIASKQFAGNPWKAIPAAVCTAVMHSGPVMIYFGQEIGVDSVVSEGFQGNDGRTTIFDYWVIEYQENFINIFFLLLGYSGTSSLV